MKKTKLKNIFWVVGLLVLVLWNVCNYDLEAHASSRYGNSGLVMKSVVENGYEKYPETSDAYGGVVYSKALNHIHEMLNNYYDSHPEYVFPKLLTKSQFDYIFYALYNPQLLSVFGLNEDLLYQHYLQMGYVLNYRVCPKIQAYVVLENQWGGKQGLYSQRETYYFDTHGGCILEELVSDSEQGDNYITYRVHHYDGNHRPARVDQSVWNLNTGTFDAKSYILQHNGQGLCTYQGLVKEQIQNSPMFQFVTGKTTQNFDKYTYDASGRCTMVKHYEGNAETERYEIEYDGVDDNGQALSHRIRSWSAENKTNMNFLARNAKNNSTNTYVYSMSKGDMRFKSDYRLYADRTRYYDITYMLDSGNVFTSVESNVSGADSLATIQKIYIMDGKEVSAEEYLARYGKQKENTVPSNEYGLPLSVTDSNNNSYTYAYVFYE